MNAKVFNALKPGGIYVVIHHVAKPGTANASDTVHRIDPAVLRSEIKAAGFRFEAEHDALRKSADVHTVIVMRP
jgi:predicted methyltransferase